MKVCQRLSGRVKLAIVEGDKVIKTFPWQDNLILDQGLNFLATTLYNQLFFAVCVGNGTNPTGRNDGGAATISGTTLTSNVSTFTSADLDSDIVFSTGQRFKIEAIINANQVTTFTSGNISIATAYTLQYTNQAILGNEIKRTFTPLETPGANGSTVTPSFITLQRTWQFPPEPTTITYSEVGFSPVNTAGSNLFSRVLLSTPITLEGPSSEVPSGQSLQITYQLNVAFDYGAGPGIFFPGNSTTTITISGLPVAYTISTYAQSTFQAGQLAVTVPGTFPPNTGQIVDIAGSSVSGYNGAFPVLNVAYSTDTNGAPISVVTLAVAWSTIATGGTLSAAQAGVYFRACQGIFLINSFGQSGAPSPTADYFVGYGEPSVAGSIWASTEGPNSMGGNGAPSRINPSTLMSAASVPTTYVPGSFYLNQVANIALSVSGQQFNLMSFGYGVPDATNQVETYCYNSPQPLAPGSTLSLTFQLSWARS